MNLSSSVVSSDPIESADAPTPIELFVDPICPWAWMTSRWLLEAAEQRNVTVRISIMSLAVLNDGRDLEPGPAAHMARAWAPARVVMAAVDAAGEEIIPRLYEAIGKRWHLDERFADGADDLGALQEAVAELELPASVLDAADRNPGDKWDVALRASHKRATDLVGTDVGTPVLSFPGAAYFGPVLSPAPRGEQAVRLLDGLLSLAGVEGFYELKRSRDVGPLVHG